MTLTTLRAIPQRPAGELLIAVTVVERFIGKIDDRHRCGKQLPTAQQFLCAVAIRLQPVMPNTLQPAG